MHTPASTRHDGGDQIGDTEIPEIWTATAMQTSCGGTARNEEDILNQCGLHHSLITKKAAGMLGVVGV